MKIRTVLGRRCRTRSLSLFEPIGYIEPGDIPEASADNFNTICGQSWTSQAKKPELANVRLHE
jgi:hypothetical protein